MGKGDDYRPVDKEKYDSNYDLIIWSDKEEIEDDKEE